MRQKGRRRYVALALEFLGLAVVLLAIAHLSPVVALIALGVVVVVVAQVLEDLL